MLRLAHRILSGNFSWALPPDDVQGSVRRTEDETERAARADIRDIPQSHIIVVDNVFDHFLRLERDLQWDDLPNIMLPFDLTWIEWTMAKMMTIDDWKIRQFGVLMRSLSLDLIREGFSKEARVLTDQASGAFMASLWAEDSGVAVFLNSTYVFLIREDGSLVEWIDLAQGPFHRDSTITTLLTPLLSLCFLHCKNVVSIDATDTAGPPEKWLRRQKQHKIRYHVLEIDPMKEVLRREGGSEMNGLKKALHICRGHFATYSPDHPLFGKYEGTFWKPAHVRGSQKEGTVLKSYAVGVSEPH